MSSPYRGRGRGRGGGRGGGGNSGSAQKSNKKHGKPSYESTPHKAQTSRSNKPVYDAYSNNEASSPWQIKPYSYKPNDSPHTQPINQPKNQSSEQYISDMLSTPRTEQSSNRTYNQSGGHYRGSGRGRGRGGYSYSASKHQSVQSTYETVGPFTVEVKPYPSRLLMIAKMSKRSVSQDNFSTITSWIDQSLPDFLINQAIEHSIDSPIQLQIELQDNDIDAVCIDQLVDSLIKSIFPLSSKHQDNSSSDPVDQPISQSQSSLVHLTALKLWENRIDDAACPSLSRLIEASFQRGLSLEELHLSHNQLTEKGAEILFKTLITCRVDRSVNSLFVDDDEVSPYPLWLRLEWNLINVKSPLISGLIEEFDYSMKQPRTKKPVTSKPTNLRRKERRAAAFAGQAGHELKTDDADNKDADNDDDVGNGADIGSDDDQSDSDDVKEDDHDDYNSESDHVSDEEAGDEVDSLQRSMRRLKFESVSLTTPPATQPAALEPNDTRDQSTPHNRLLVCYAGDRQKCSVRMCRFGRFAAHVHLYCWSLQHTRFDESDLLNVISTSRGKSRKVPASATKPAAGQPSDVAAAAVEPIPRPVSSTSSTSSASLLSLYPSSKPLILFLDTNVVFAMISASQQLQTFHWDNLYKMADATPPQFGSELDSPNERVYIVLSAAVLHEMDHRKEFNKKLQTSPSMNKHYYENHLAMQKLSQQIKRQFELTIADPSQSFLARCKRQGWLQTLSINDSANSVMYDASALDVKNSTNDRQIMNMTRHWQSSIGERGIVMLLSEDGNIRHECELGEDIDCASVKAIDAGLLKLAAQHPNQKLILSAGVIRQALRLGLDSLGKKGREVVDRSAVEAKRAAMPVRSMDMNVYEALQACQRVISQYREGASACECGSVSMPVEEEVDRLMEACESIVAHAPRLLADMRKNIGS